MNGSDSDLKALVAANYALTLMIFGKLQTSGFISVEEASQLLSNADDFLEDSFAPEVVVQARQMLAAFLQASRNIS